MPVSVSFVIKTSIMIVLMTTVYFTITAEVDLAQKQKYFNHMKEIAWYAESKIANGLNAVNAYDSNNTQRLMLPQLGVPYSVSLSCGDYLSINVSSNAGRHYEVIEFMNCSKINASGVVYAGERCVTVTKASEAMTSVELRDSCGDL